MHGSHSGGIPRSVTTRLGKSRGNTLKTAGSHAVTSGRDGSGTTHANSEGSPSNRVWIASVCMPASKAIKAA